MQFKWLEKWAEDGLLSQEAKDRIYGDCYKIIKTAKETNKPSPVEVGSYKKLASLDKAATLRTMVRSLIGESSSASKTASVKEIPNLDQIFEKVGEDAAVHFHLLKIAVDPEGLSKTALMPAMSTTAFKEVARNLLLMSSYPLVAGVALGGVKEVLARRDAAEMRKRLEGSYAKAMASAKGDERSVLNENPAAAREAFTALSNFAPHIAAEPLAAGAFMAKIVSYNHGLQMEDIRTMTDVEKNMVDARSKGLSGFSAGFSEGAGAMGLQPNVSHVLKSSFQPFVQHTEDKIRNGGK